MNKKSRKKLVRIFATIVAVALIAITILSVESYMADNASATTAVPTEQKAVPTNIVVTVDEPIKVKTIELYTTEPEQEQEPESEPEAPAIEPVATDYAYGFTLATREKMARTLYQEGNVDYVGWTEASKVVWTMINRFMSGIKAFVTGGAYAYLESVTEENLAVVNDVIDRYLAELNGANDVGRTLPSDFYYFWGDGRTNHFYKYASGGLGRPGDDRIYFNGAPNSPYDS